MKKINDILEEEVLKSTKGTFDFEGNKINYQTHNHVLISFYFESHGTKKNYLYNRRIKEIRFVCEKAVRNTSPEPPQSTKTPLVMVMFIGFLMILFMEFGSASISGLEAQKVNTSITLPQTSNSATYQNISSILLGNGTILFLNAQMTKNGFDFFYVLNSTYTSSLGLYCVNGYGNDLDDPTWQYCFDVTRLGFTSDSGSSIIYSVLLILLILFDLFIVYIIVMLNPSNYTNEKGEPIGISIKKYLRIVLIGITYALVLLTLNLMAVVSSATDSTQFYNIITGIFSLMIKMVWIWSVMIFIWIMVAVWKDNQLIKEIRQRLGEGEWGI